MSMPLALYMDVHVPMAITLALRRKRLDILTSQDDGTARLHDAMLLQRATDLQRVLFSQDHDFLKITSEWQRQGRTFSGVVYAPQQAVSLGGSPTISSSSSPAASPRSFRTGSSICLCDRYVDPDDPRAQSISLTMTRVPCTSTTSTSESVST
jgi:hypothetical protein